VREYAIINNILDGNRAEYGGGMSLDIQDRMGEAFSATIMNNTLFANAASGIFLYGANEAAFTITNTAVVSHETGVSVPGDQTHVAMAYTLWNDVQQATDNPAMVEDTHSVTGPVDFVDAAAGNFRLRKTSAARDAGDPAGVPPAPDHDADGNPRPFGPRVDIGAFEWRGFERRLPMVSVALPPRAGWAIGWGENDGAVILHTADNGRAWTAQVVAAQWPGMPGNDISAVDDQTAWAALGANSDAAPGLILRTTNGGATWISQTLPAGLVDAVKGIKGLSAAEAWAATLHGTVLHTTDGGASWDIVPHPGVPITLVNRMDADGTGNVWIADSSFDGAVVRTRDGGLTWRREQLPSVSDGPRDTPLTVHTVNPTVTWASGTQGAIFYRTVNGGGQWDTVATVGGLDHLDDVCAAGADDAWGAQNGDGVNGFIWRVHVDGGGAQAHNVTPLAVNGYTPAGVTCIGATTAWVVANRGMYTDPSRPDSVIVHTQDGAVWEQQAVPVNASLWKVSFAGARR
jgi:photosystem II stability/assembly factor-like uncharacterized protein